MKVVLTFLLVACWSMLAVLCKQGQKISSTDEVTDIKEFKKILRTKNNVLVCFINNPKKALGILTIFKEAAEIIRGQGTMLIIECTGETKKLCKKLKVPTEVPYTLRHYKDGDFHKVYDRKETAASIVNFMRDPTGDIPWNEDDSLGSDVVHLSNLQSLLKLVRKETRPVLIMFYAPWCGFCKQLKPEYSKAATTLKGKAVLAAIDVNRPENTPVRAAFNITGFPTLHYFKNGEWGSTYDGENKHDDLVNFVNNDGKSPPKPKEPEWSDTPTDVVHLTEETFANTASQEESMLVMFYAPWCGHCKRLKPEYEKAATQMKTENIKGILAAVDATKEQTLAKKFKVKGYPTIKYYNAGQERWDVPHLRDADKIVSFMKKPQKPEPTAQVVEPDWENTDSEIVHLNSENFKPVLKKKRHTLVMFYAPWCGHCKATKPEFIKAAEEVKDNLRMAFAALDCTKHQTLCSLYEVTGYPTFKYFHYYNKATDEYTGGRKKADFLTYMRLKDEDRSTKDIPAEPEPMPVWTDITGSDRIIQITDSNHLQILKKHASALVMFFDTGCSVCNELMKDFAKASKSLDPSITVLAACDCKENEKLIVQYNITNRPVLKYFKNGRYISDYKGNLTKPEIESFVHSLITKDEL